MRIRQNMWWAHKGFKEMENQCSISIFTDLAKTSTLEVMKMSPNLKDNSKMVEPIQRERYVLRGVNKGLGGVIKGLAGDIKVLWAFSSKFVKGYENEPEFEGQKQNGRTTAEGEVCINVLGGINKGLGGVIKVLGVFKPLR